VYTWISSDTTNQIETIGKEKIKFGRHVSVNRNHARKNDEERKEMMKNHDFDEQSGNYTNDNDRKD